jgi:hypothetical protein
MAKNGSGEHAEDYTRETELSEEALLGNLRLRIYRKACGYYSKEKRSRVEQVLDPAEIQELQAYADEYYHYANSTPAKLKQNLVGWAKNFPEQNVQKYLKQLVENLFTWGV